MILKPTVAPVLLALLALLGLSAPARAQPDETPAVMVTAKASKTTVAPGDQVVVAVVLDHAEGFHSWPHQPVVPKGSAFKVEDAIATTVAPAKGGVDPRLVVHEAYTQWPEAHTVRTAGMMVPAYSGHAVAFLPITISADAKPGPATLDLIATYQSCNEQSCLPREDVPLKIEFTIAPVAPAAAALDPDFAGFDPSIWAAIQSGAAPTTKAIPAAPASKAVTFDIFGYSFTIDPSGVVGLSLLLMVAALGGLLLNFTPCVLPVVPLKIMGLSQAAGHPARCFYLGAVMSLGVVAFWMAIGIAIASISGFTAISSLFSTPWFSLIVGLFILVMGVGMLGAFAVRLPQAVYMVNPSHETARGSFLFGIMTAVLSTPCTAPLMGSAAAWATTQRPAITLLTFGAIGAGMALPYLILSANPKLVSKMPRTGPASELIKQVMGILMLAVAAFFLGLGLSALIAKAPTALKVAHWWVVGALVIIAAAWMVYRTFQITRAPGKRGATTALGAAMAAAAVLVTLELGVPSKAIPWQLYTPELYAAQRAAGKVVVLDFTAEWCLTCKAIEASVLHRKAVIKALNSPDVVPIKVDLSDTNPKGIGWVKLKEIGEVGIPILLIEGPGLQTPFKSNAYTPAQVIGNISKARGTLAQRPVPSPGTP